MTSPLYLPTPNIPPSTGAHLPNAPTGMGVPAAGLSPINYWAQFGGLTFSAVDQTGTKWFFSDPDGWADGVPISMQTEQRGDSHGAWMGTSYLEPRNIVFSGQVIAPTPTLAWQARNALLGVIASLSSLGLMNVDTPLTINEPDAAKTCYVRPSDKPTITMVDTNVFTFEIPLVAHDPRKYSAVQNASANLPVATSGLTFPVGPFGVTFGGSGSSGLVQVSNAGNFVTSPVLSIIGPCTNPIATNTTTGEQMILSTTLGSADSLSIDCDLYTITLNGSADRGNIALPGSKFLTLVPEVNILQFTASSYSSAAMMTVSWSSVWW